MNPFYLYTEHYCYTSVRGILWRISPYSLSNFIPDKPTEELSRIIEFSSGKIALVDWEGITNVHAHALNGLFQKLKLSETTVLFINFEGLEKSSLTDPCNAFGIHHVSIGDVVIILSGKPIQNADHRIAEIIEEIKNERAKRVNDYILGCADFHVNSEFKPLASTPLLSNGEYNSNKIIGSPEAFFWITFAMAEKVLKTIEENRIGKSKKSLKLLSVSLRACSLGAAISMLTGCALETINHFGPVNIPYNIEGDLATPCEYIYIGDFTIGGTEIKIAQTYAALKNSVLENGIVLGSLFTPTDYKHIVRIYPIVDFSTINSSTHSKIEFKLPSK